VSKSVLAVVGGTQSQLKLTEPPPLALRLNSKAVILMEPDVPDTQGISTADPMQVFGGSSPL